VGCPGFPLDWNGFFCCPWVKHGWCSVAETHSKERLAGSELLHLQLQGKKHRNQRFGLFAQGSGPPRYPPNGVRGEETSKCWDRTTRWVEFFGLNKSDLAKDFNFQEFKLPTLGIKSKFICVWIEIKDEMGVKCCLRWRGDIYCKHESNSTSIFPARLPIGRQGFIVMSYIFNARTRWHKHFEKWHAHMQWHVILWSVSAGLDRSANWCSLMIPEHPRVCSCADCIPDRREAFIFTADKDQLPDSIGLTSRFYKHAKNSTWQETCSQENLNEESRFEKTVFEKTRKRKITCRSFCNHTFLFGVAVVFLFRMLAFSHFFFRLRGFG